MTYIALSTSDLVAVSVFVVLNGLLSLRLALGIERQLAIAAVRMVVQLAAVGAVLTLLFGVASLPWTLAMALVMVLVAGREVVARQTHRFTAGWGYLIGTATMTVAAGSLTAVALVGTLRPEPWYDPRYAIPLLGMILGNTMTGIALGLDSLTTAVAVERSAIEARIALGATRWQAMHRPVRSAMRRGLMPLVNAMATTGIVSLPGMMTGQILAGAAPADAVRYQILVMFLIAGATGIGVLAAIYAAAWRLTDERDRLRPDRLRATF